MEEVVLVNKQIIIRFTIVVQNLATLQWPNYVMKYSNRDLLAKVTKNLAIKIFDSWLLKANLECPIRFFVHFSKTLTY